ncbi:protein phosphatase [Sediminihabitans luteus]|uniref:Protein phosphatase n=1 Tax=Sediminihabitans luteus TaxID=1138585 RepID=A0A2M9CCU7_9CELL|nr:protein phosphatase 2C domain-containing protein [Sediminihabitans luteus]PJJ69169.1 protein phosphatase [Sediminihabitans luteus]GII98841.1 serine/threonine protein phosphatase [Sediminihabitans luteus]
MNIALRYAARSDVGLVRSNNQDSGYAGDNLLVVADGMGGHAGGDVASALTIAALTGLDEPRPAAEAALGALEEAVDGARQDLVHRTEVSPELTGMGTTVTALLLAGPQLVLAHLGDSRAYLLRDGVLTQATTDHTFVQHLVDTGRISPEEAETHPQRNVVMRVLGDFDVDLTPDMSLHDARPGDRWLLCSDGLSGFVSPDELTATLEGVADVDACADRLVQLALRAGSTDNITAVVTEVVDLDALDDAAAAAPASAPQVVGSAASAELLPPAPEHPEDVDLPELPEDDADVRDDPRRPWVPVIGSTLLLVGLGIAGWAGYAWTQTQYFVGIADGEVAVYQGVPTDLGPISLSSPVETTGTLVASLPELYQNRLEETIPASSREDAVSRASEISDEAVLTPSTAEPTDEPTDAPTTAAPTAEPTASP